MGKCSKVESDTVEEHCRVSVIEWGRLRVVQKRALNESVTRKLWWAFS